MSDDAGERIGVEAGPIVMRSVIQSPRLGSARNETFFRAVPNTPARCLSGWFMTSSRAWAASSWPEAASRETTRSFRPVDSHW